MKYAIAMLAVIAFSGCLQQPPHRLSAEKKVEDKSDGNGNRALVGYYIGRSAASRGK